MSTIDTNTESEKKSIARQNYEHTPSGQLRRMRVTRIWVKKKSKWPLTIVSIRKRKVLWLSPGADLLACPWRKGYLSTIRKRKT